jgi:hypothetical protein
MRCSDPSAGTCPPLPDAFVRLRYFFGKRLGVADLRDEQAYHRGKGRFHNRHLHGSGVVCGLALSRFEVEGGDATVLRVSAGAALDTCGREIIVGQDQCIDLAAWFRRRQEEATREGATFPPTGAVAADGTMRVHVAVRYRECPTAPEPAPRDPCSSDGGGCEFGRVVESFELGVLFAEEVSDAVRTGIRHPNAETLRTLLEGAPDSEAFAAALATELTGPCPETNDPDWIVLGTFDTTVKAPADDATAPPDLVALSDEADWEGPPSWLLSTSALQDLLLAAVLPAPGALPPPVLGLTLTTGALDDTLSVALAAEVDAESPTTGFLELRSLAAGAWSNVTLGTITAVGGALPSLDIVIPGGLAVGTRGTLALTRAGGLMDAHFRPIVADFYFRIEDDGAGGRRLVVTSFTRPGLEVG